MGKNDSDRDASVEEAVAAIKGSVQNMPVGSRIALVTLQGSMCPVTLAHLDSLEEARRFLLNVESKRQQVAERPKQLPVFDHVLGFLGANDDGHVAGKFGGRRASAGFMPLRDRMELVDLAIADYDWIVSCDNIWKCAQALLDEFPDRGIIWFEIDGADVVLRSRTWNRAWEGRRYACVGRPSEEGKDNGTEAVLRCLEEDGKGPGSDWYNEGSFLLLPELPDISSTKVREALRAQDTAALEGLVHPGVARWAAERNSGAAKAVTAAAASYELTQAAPTSSRMPLRRASACMVSGSLFGLWPRLDALRRSSVCGGGSRGGRARRAMACRDAEADVAVARPHLQASRLVAGIHCRGFAYAANGCPKAAVVTPMSARVFLGL